MQEPYSIEELGTETGSKVIVVKNNSEEKKLAIVVTIYGYSIKTDSGFRALAEFFEDDNKIEDLQIIIKNKKFWSLIEYYHKASIDLLSKEEDEEEMLLSDDTKFGQDPGRTVKASKFLAEVARSITSRSSSKINKTLDPNFLIVLGSIRHGFSVYTTFRNYNHEEITIARTHTGMGTYANKYANLTLFNRKLSTVFFYLHLANVLPFSLIIAVVNAAAAAAYYTGTTSEVSFSQVTFNPEQLGTLFYLVILPLIWPITGFLLRTYIPKIFPTIVRYAIKRNLKS